MGNVERRCKMKFIVSRTSIWGDDEKPCKEAKQEKLTWCGETENCWVVEINTLEDLIKFYKKYGDLILEESDVKEAPIKIEIYDTYRE
jgi:hypothetical protein